MIKEIRYICEGCHKSFYSEYSALDCERSHITPKRISSFKYKEFVKHLDRVFVEMADNSVIEYEMV